MYVFERRSPIYFLCVYPFPRDAVVECGADYCSRISAGKVQGKDVDNLSSSGGRLDDAAKYVGEGGRARVNI